MEETALGEMGMTEKQLFRISPRSLFNKLYGFLRAERENWERARIIAYTNILPYVPEEERPFGPGDLLHFPWDPDKLKAKGEGMSPERAAEKRKRAFDEIDALERKRGRRR